MSRYRKFRRASPWISCFSTVLFISAGPCLADTVILKEGKTLTGVITGETPTALTIDTATGRFTLQKLQVRSFNRASASENEARQWKQLLAEGQLDAAVTALQSEDFQQAFTPAEEVGFLLDGLRGCAGEVTCTSHTLGMLRQQLSAADTPPDLRLLMAALYMDNIQPDAASQQLSQLTASPPPQFTWPKNEIAALLDRIVSRAIQQNCGSCVSMASSLAAASGPTPQDDSYLAAYFQIEELIRRQDYLNAIARFRPEMFLHRADIYVPMAHRLITTLLSMPSTAQTLSLLESCQHTLLPYVDKDDRAKVLKAIIKLQCTQGNYTRAQALADQITSSDPDLGASLQHLLDFEKRRNELPPKDLTAKYKLAAWARQVGLYPEARALFIELRPDPRFAETVNLQLQIIDNTTAKAEYARLRSLYDQNKYTQLNQEVAEFLKTSPPPEYAQEAKALLQLVDFEKWSKGKIDVGKAEAEFQQAERYAQRREYDQALLVLNKIQTNLTNTPLAERARTLRERIMKDKARQARTPQ